ncbi:hypothetical protein D3C84_1234440 [compost metagenome]
MLTLTASGSSVMLCVCPVENFALVFRKVLTTATSANQRSLKARVLPTTRLPASLLSRR